MYVVRWSRLQNGNINFFRYFVVVIFVKFYWEVKIGNLVKNFITLYLHKLKWLQIKSRYTTHPNRNLDHDDLQFYIFTISILLHRWCHTTNYFDVEIKPSCIEHCKFRCADYYLSSIKNIDLFFRIVIHSIIEKKILCHFCWIENIIIFVSSIGFYSWNKGEDDIEPKTIQP